MKVLCLARRSAISSIFFALCFLFISISRSSAQSVTAAGYSFTASSKTFTYLTGGTTLANVQTDDGYDVITIFPFRFCGSTYTDVLLCANGWLKFGTVPTYIDPYMNRNNVLAEGQYPCIYPLYEDINGDAGTSKYQITGTAPNRVFVWECRDFKWDYAAPTASVSFQLYLFEATGKIECIYKQEPGAVVLNLSGGATIGIANSSTDWQTLNLPVASPVSSSTTYTYNISSVPPTGQSYLWDPGTFCSQPTNLTLGLVNSTNVNFSWTAPVTTSLGYEYIVDMNSGSPAASATVTATTGTTGSASGLTPNTQYYIHLRNKCATNNYSTWINFPVKTLPACSQPTGFKTVYLSNDSASFIWDALVTGTDYQYILTQTKLVPSGNTAGVVVTTSNAGQKGQLQEGKTYYVYVRSRCPGDDSSGWMLDSFYVPIECKIPQVSFTEITSNRAVAYWQPVFTGLSYEYAITKTSADPPGGVTTLNTSVLLPYLDIKAKYYFHIKSHCTDRGVPTESPWAVFEFVTLGVGITDVTAGEDGILVYPNPAGDNITVSMSPGMLAENAKLSILDVSGRILKVVAVNKDLQQLNVSDIPAGVYFIKYTAEDNTQVTRFTKQ